MLLYSLLFCNFIYVCTYVQYVNNPLFMHISVKVIILTLTLYLLDNARGEVQYSRALRGVSGKVVVAEASAKFCPVVVSSGVASKVEFISGAVGTPLAPARLYRYAARRAANATVTTTTAMTMVLVGVEAGAAEVVEEEVVTDVYGALGHETSNLLKYQV